MSVLTIIYIPPESSFFKDCAFITAESANKIDKVLAKFSDDSGNIESLQRCTPKMLQGFRKARDDMFKELKRAKKDLHKKNGTQLELIELFESEYITFSKLCEHLTLDSNIVIEYSDRPMDPAQVAGVWWTVLRVANCIAESKNIHIRSKFKQAPAVETLMDLAQKLIINANEDAEDASGIPEITDDALLKILV